MWSLKRFIKKIYNVCIGKYEIIDTCAEKYISYEKKYITRKELKKYNVKKLFGHILVKDIQNDKIYNVKRNFTDFVKGEKYLFEKWNGTFRIATCTAVSRNMPPLFDGSETVGIGYDVVGQIV